MYQMSILKLIYAQLPNSCLAVIVQALKFNMIALCRWFPCEELIGAVRLRYKQKYVDLVRDFLWAPCALHHIHGLFSNLNGLFITSWWITSVSMRVSYFHEFYYLFEPGKTHFPFLNVKYSCDSPAASSVVWYSIIVSYMVSYDGYPLLYFKW